MTDLAVALSGAVFVNRKNQKSAIAAMSRAGEDMKRRGVSRVQVPARRLTKSDFIVDIPRGYPVVNP